MSTQQVQGALSAEPKVANMDTQQKLFQMLAEGLAAKSERWRLLFAYARTKEIEPWKVVSFIYMIEAGTKLSESYFIFARVAKLLATTEKYKVNETLLTKKDLVSWNRQAVLAMIEAVKLKDGVEEKIERGYKAIELINALFPEFLIEDQKSSPFPRW